MFPESTNHLYPPDSAVCGRIVSRNIATVRTVSLSITVEAHVPGGASWKARRITTIRAIARVDNDNDVITRAAIIPAMKSEDLVLVVHMENIDILTM